MKSFIIEISPIRIKQTFLCAKNMDAEVHIKQWYCQSSDEFPVQKLFLSKYGQFPRRTQIEPIADDDGLNIVFHVQSVLDRIDEEFNIRNELPIVRRYFHRCSRKYFILEQVLSLVKIEGIMIHLDSCRWVTNFMNHSKKPIQPDYIPDRHFLIVDRIVLFYLPEHEIFVQKLTNELINNVTLSLAEPKIANLRLIGKRKDRCDGPGAFYLTDYIHIKKPLINNLAISYGGEDFLHIHKRIVTWLNAKNSSGLVLLHGTPGSGKTHYIRYLLHSLRNDPEKYPIYVPSDMINDLTSPRLLPLLINHPNSLLIIEDAEGSLSRSRTSNQSIANLLNLSDGLLSDGIPMQIIATFNCPLISLDSALLRPGRLIVEYCFPSTLPVENARLLAESIGISKLDQINQPISLAEIYALREEKIADDQDESTASSCSHCSPTNLYRLGQEE